VQKRREKAQTPKDKQQSKPNTPQQSIEPSKLDKLAPKDLRRIAKDLDAVMNDEINQVIGIYVKAKTAVLDDLQQREIDAVTLVYSAARSAASLELANRSVQ